MSIASNLSNKLKELPKSVQLVAVSKTKPNSDILEAYNAGQRIFGENKVQDLAAKEDALPKDIEWHMIGHLQTNKVKYIASFVSLIHSVESIKLLKTINKEGLKNNRIIDCLLEIKLGLEDSKFGLSKEDTLSILNSEEYLEMTNIRIVGVMGMATNTEDNKLIQTEFESLTEFSNSLKKTYFSNINSFKEISMGMSSDYSYAIAAGSTMVRIGSAIFGTRNYG
ncbi:MAG: YggS family pyridoxal phosphate-dependent enzyme [Flavobacteriales bacterium]|nr:YggS family pyridoxal phosphate-dependent enzyme [Flavobacteriales bacterium]